MTNKFLFRAKSVMTKSWVYGNFHYVGDDCFMIGFDDVEHCFMSSELRTKYKIFQRVYRIESSTLGAYSGLSRMTIKYIERVFEGDEIVMNDRNLTMYTVLFDNFEWRVIDSDGKTIRLRQLDVSKGFCTIGNIY